MIGEEAVFGERLHVISANDSLWSICQAEYGSARYTTALGRYNRDRIPHADKLVLGATLRIPPPEVLESTFPELFQVRPHRDGLVAPAGGGGDAGVGSEPAAGLFVTPAGERRYRVGRNETLTSIAAQVLGRGSRWIELYNLNRDQLATPESLKIGMELKLPPAASRVGVAPAPSLSR
jgi:nucleoid-associated protein YgaU